MTDVPEFVGWQRQLMVLFVYPFILICCEQAISLWLCERYRNMITFVIFLQNSFRESCVFLFCVIDISRTDCSKVTRGYTPAKDEVEDEMDLVYRVPCKNASSYIDQLYSPKIDIVTKQRRIENI